MNKRILLKPANWIFKNAFPIYKFLYFAFKKRQDSFNLSLLKRYIKDGDTVLDIGANIGFFTVELSKLVGKRGQVHSFEPDEKNFLHLLKGTSNLYNVTINKKAVADKEGLTTLYYSDALNVEHTTYKPLHFEQTFEIEQTSIDNYIQSKFPVSFIKMDIQGAELNALKGMCKTLNENENIVILSELWPYGLKNCGNTPTQVIDLLLSLNFNIYMIENDSLRKFNTSDLKNFREDEKYYYNFIASRKNLND